MYNNIRLSSLSQNISKRANLCGTHFVYTHVRALCNSYYCICISKRLRAEIIERKTVTQTTSMRVLYIAAYILDAMPHQLTVVRYYKYFV